MLFFSFLKHCYHPYAHLVDVFSNFNGPHHIHASTAVIGSIPHSFSNYPVLIIQTCEFCSIYWYGVEGCAIVAVHGRPGLVASTFCFGRGVPGSGFRSRFRSQMLRYTYLFVGQKRKQMQRPHFKIDHQPKKGMYHKTEAPQAFRKTAATVAGRPNETPQQRSINIRPPCSGTILQIPNTSETLSSQTNSY